MTDIKEFYIQVEDISELDFSKILRDTDFGLAKFINENFINGYSAEYTADELLKEIKKEGS